MSSLPISSQVEVFDLRHFSARQLRPLLEREAELWRQRLRWDYKSSTELLLQYLESRILHGFVAVDRGRVAGYTFCVYEGHKAVIGDAFAIGQNMSIDSETMRLLLVNILEMLRHTPGVERIESQLLLFDAGEFADVFRGSHFTTYPRLFLERDLGSPLQLTSTELPPDLELMQWATHDYQPAAELIYTSYIDHSDALINDQYRSLHGSLRFLHNIVRFPGCGVFEPSLSWILRDKRTRAVVGTVLSSRIAAQVAHITQLCVAPRYRGRGLGGLLLGRSGESLSRAGFQAVSLTVTEDNQQAVRLYNRFGFRMKHRFDAMVMQAAERLR